MIHSAVDRKPRAVAPVQDQAAPRTIALTHRPDVASLIPPNALKLKEKGRAQLAVPGASIPMQKRPPRTNHPDVLVVASPDVGQRSAGGQSDLGPRVSIAAEQQPHGLSTAYRSHGPQTLRRRTVDAG